MSKKKKTFTISIIGILTISIIFLGCFNMQVNALVDLGYPKSVAKEKTKITNLFSVVSNEKKSLQKDIDHTQQELIDLGLKNHEVLNIAKDEDKLVSQLNLLKDEKEVKVSFYQKSLSQLEAIAKKYNIKYQYPDTNVYNRNIYLSTLLNKNNGKLIAQYREYLIKQGYSKQEIRKLKGKNSHETLSKLQVAYNKEAKKQNEQLNQFSSKELRDSAMRMFRETNEYRASKGLRPYKYNYKMQSCVFKEANAYARNKNPHNWACQPIANENAGLASAKSDYVKLAMDFFKTDPPHEQVLLGNHNSVAIAIVTKDGMNYMIMDVFN